MPMDATSRASFQFFLSKKNNMSNAYTGNKNVEEPKKVKARNIFVAKGDSRDKIAFETALSNPLSCSKTISSAIATNTKNARINKTTAIRIRSVTHFAILSLNPEFFSLKNLRV